MAEKIVGRLQTPADENGERKDIHLITSTDEVITPDGSTLTEKMTQTGIQVSETKPEFACTWFRPKS